MLCSLENYYWRYTSASELVNMILAFVETRAYALFQTAEFLTLSESMVQMIMCRYMLFLTFLDCIITFLIYFEQKFRSARSA